MRTLSNKLKAFKENVTRKQLLAASMAAFVMLIVAWLLCDVFGERAWVGALPFMLAIVVGGQFFILQIMQMDLRSGLRAQQIANYQSTEALFGIFTFIKPRLPLPPLDGWAISPHTAVELITQIRLHQPQKILELGSGASTLIASYCLENLGRGQILSLDHNAYFGSKTNDNLKQHGLDGIAKVVYAPLTLVEVQGSSWQWYDLMKVPQLKPLRGQIDLLVIDGPPQDLQPLSRLPAFFALYDYLREGALILLDDYDRPDEKAIVKQALNDFRLEIVAVAVGDNAIVLRKMKK